jgi:hypothetical protein
MNDANINFLASAVSHVMYNLKAYKKNIVLLIVAIIRDIVPVQPNSQGNKLKGTIANEYTNI